MAQLPLSDIVSVSVSQAGVGAVEYNTSNLALFTEEVYANSFGSLEYKAYTSPTDVATDFGSDSNTYAQALAVFSQQPNILANHGQLIVIPIDPETQTLTFSGTAASGVFVINFDGHATANINWNDTASQIQTKVRALVGLEQAVVSGSIAAHTVGIDFNGYYGNAALITITGDTLATSVPAAVTIVVAQVSAGETIADAITRSADVVQYFGIIGDLLYSDADITAAAAVVQALNKIAFWGSKLQVAVEPDGIFDALRSANDHKNRCLLYIGDEVDLDTITMVAAYAGRALSTNFDGSNTTQNMHLKELTGVTADGSIDQTILDLSLSAGADCYPSLQGLAKVYSSGENRFYDQVYNLGWFVGALQIAAFNYLATTGTKIPQTENGMDGLKGAVRQVCQQAVTNQYCAPGTWNSPDTFGNQVDFLQNISQVGYYIFSQPITQQSQAARVAREAPIIQVALKEAGAINSATIIVSINA